MVERLIVGLIVVVAFFYAAWALLPTGLRASLAYRVGAWGQAPGRAPWLSRTATWLGRRIDARSGGCADCNAAGSPRTSDRGTGHPRA